MDHSDREDDVEDEWIMDGDEDNELNERIEMSPQQQSQAR